MNKYLLILILTTFIKFGKSKFTPTFCSVTCGKITCLLNNTSINGCTACNTGWTLSGNTCNPNTASNYYLFDKTTDLGGNLNVSPNNNPNTICSGNYDSIGYSVFGWSNSGTSNQITVSSNQGIPKSFYLMIVYFGIISVDACQGGCGGKKYWNDNT